jgi:DNA processing protein
LLYAIGRIELLQGPALAIVGSRNASVQGVANAAAFGHALSAAGITIVSGLALGIDTAAHQGGLRGVGATVAVIGTGADRIYPPRNRELAYQIAREGCILSEYPLGTMPQPANFPPRNRLISGLCCGVLVVEAAARSGSLITAHVAADQGREVFAIPGSIHAPLSKGCHQLIKEGARLVESAADVLLELRHAPLLGGAPEAGPAYRGAHLTLLEAMGQGPVDADQLGSFTGSDPGTVSSELLALELAGQVERLPGGLFQRINR